MTESLCYSPETITTLLVKSIMPQTKVKEKIKNMQKPEIKKKKITDQYPLLMLKRSTKHYQTKFSSILKRLYTMNKWYIYIEYKDGQNIKTYLHNILY